MIEKRDIETRSSVVISLPAEEKGLNLTIEDFLPSFSRKLASLFFHSNWVIMIFVFFVYIVDNFMVYSGKIMPSDRNIDGKIISYLIGATVVQTASILSIVVTSLLKNRSIKHEKKTV